MGEVAISVARQVSSCVPGTPGCPLRPETVPRKPLFEGFGVHEALIIGTALFATLVGLVLVTWLLAVATGANRDFADAKEPRPGPVPWLDIRPSTWVCVAAVLALATGTGAWVALGSDSEGGVASATTLGPAGSSTTRTTATSANACPPPKLTATFLPVGFTNRLVAGAGQSFINDDGCYFHYKGTAAVVTVISSGVSPFGPPGSAQAREVVGGRTLWVGATPQGAIGVLIEESEMGGTADFWYTLVSNTVSRSDLLLIAAGLQRCENC